MKILCDCMKQTQMNSYFSVSGLKTARLVYFIVIHESQQNTQVVVKLIYH